MLIFVSLVSLFSGVPCAAAAVCGANPPCAPLKGASGVPAILNSSPSSCWMAPPSVESVLLVGPHDAGMLYGVLAHCDAAASINGFSPYHEMDGVSSLFSHSSAFRLKMVISSCGNSSKGGEANCNILSTVSLASELLPTVQCDAKDDACRKLHHLPARVDALSAVKVENWLYGQDSVFFTKKVY